MKVRSLGISEIFGKKVCVCVCDPDAANTFPLLSLFPRPCSFSADRNPIRNPLSPPPPPFYPMSEEEKPPPPPFLEKEKRIKLLQSLPPFKELSLFA